MNAACHSVAVRLNLSASVDSSCMTPAETADAKRKLRAMGISMAGMTDTQRSEVLEWASGLPDREVNSVPREVRAPMPLSPDGDIERFAALVDYGPEDRDGPDGFRFRKFVTPVGVADAA